MDLPRPDLSDNQDYLPSFAYESGHCTEDHLLRDFSFCNRRDMLEEDALNEKACMQVLKIWIDKADEDIVKLEEDILMVQCQQLVCDDEEWSKHCSAALREKIDHLDILIESLKKDDTGNGLESGTEALPPRLHDLLKPLLEDYLAKSEQTETSIKQMAAVELSNKKTEGIMLKTYERKSNSMELEERKLSLPQQNKDAVIRNFSASSDALTNHGVSERVISKSNTLEGRRMPNLVQVKSELADPVANESSASLCIYKANSREIEGKRNSNNKAISEVKVVQGRIQHKIKVDSMSPRLDASSTVQKVRVYRRAINENVPSSTKPSVKMKGKSRILPQTLQAVKDESIEQVKKPRMESEHQIQVQRKCHQILQNSPLAEHEDKGTSSAENLVEQRKDGVSKGMVMKGNNAPEVTAPTIVLPQEVKELSFTSQTTSKKGGLQISQMKLVKVERDALNSTAEGAKNTPSNIKNKKALTVRDLRAIAKSRKLRGYNKLKKEQLRTLLGVE